MATKKFLVYIRSARAHNYRVKRLASRRRPLATLVSKRCRTSLTRTGFTHKSLARRMQQVREVKCSSKARPRRFGQRAFSFSFWLGFLVCALDLVQGQAAQAQNAYDFNRRLGTGINLGNALEAPKEGDWGVVLQADYFRLIKEAGFTHVRLPVSWSTHAGAEPPYTLEPAFVERVEWALKQARANGLAVVLNMHHYGEMEENPGAHTERFLSMWKQISEHFANQPEDVAFEIYNEPAKKMDADKWNAMFDRALNIVRATNPHRCVVVGPVNWNSIDQLQSLQLPADKNLLVTVHYYSPIHFTHQGASWIGAESNAWLGTTWTGAEKETAELSSDFDKAYNWGHEHDLPLYLGEFGAFSKAAMDSRARWTKAVLTEAQKRNMSTAYWEFCSGFGAYDPETRQWREPILKALQTRIAR